MTDAHCRIGRVKLKGGADLKIFEGTRKPAANGVLRELEMNVKDFIDDYKNTACGFAIIVWDECGYRFNSRCIGPAPVCRNTLPEYLAEAARRDNAYHEARHVIYDL